MNERVATPMAHATATPAIWAMAPTLVQSLSGMLSGYHLPKQLTPWAPKRKPVTGGKVSQSWNTPLRHYYPLTAIGIHEPRPRAYCGRVASAISQGFVRLSCGYYPL